MHGSLWGEQIVPDKWTHHQLSWIWICLQRVPWTQHDNTHTYTHNELHLNLESRKTCSPEALHLKLTLNFFSIHPEFDWEPASSPHPETENNKHTDFCLDLASFFSHYMEIHGPMAWPHGITTHAWRFVAMVMLWWPVNEEWELKETYSAHFQVHNFIFGYY